MPRKPYDAVRPGDLLVPDPETPSEVRLVTEVTYKTAGGLFLTYHGGASRPVSNPAELVEVALPSPVVDLAWNPAAQAWDVDVHRRTDGETGDLHLHVDSEPWAPALGPGHMAPVITAAKAVLQEWSGESTTWARAALRELLVALSDSDNDPGVRAWAMSVLPEPTEG